MADITQETFFKYIFAEKHFDKPSIFQSDLHIQNAILHQDKQYYKVMNGP